MQELRELCLKARKASRITALLSGREKDRALSLCAEALLSHCEEILSANRQDMEEAEDQGMSEGLLDRLSLTEKRIADMAAGMRAVAALEDPVGRVLERFTRPNGLVITKISVPFGVIGMIYEARPNVTADAFALCFKAGSACILKGGSAAKRSNQAILSALRKGLSEAGLPEEAVTLLPGTDRESTLAFMGMRGLVDVLIPRGSAGLIRSVVEHAAIPVIETGTGNCHVYVDASADVDMALKIILNAKTQRVGVCNACESLLIHKDIAPKAVPLIAHSLMEHQVQIFGDEPCRRIFPKLSAATEEDWGTEYLDYKISMKEVDSLEEAIAHINHYGTGHSECIVTGDPEAAGRFRQQVDAACVYVNASTRFTDGGEFGFGAEIGISTQKLHARGPMGLREITSYKYLIDGKGQVR